MCANFLSEAVKVSALETAWRLSIAGVLGTLALQRVVSAGESRNMKSRDDSARTLWRKH